jgi:hypothetical protein
MSNGHDGETITRAKPTVTANDQRIIRQTFSFMRGMVANPGIVQDIPDGANLVLIPPHNPELAAIEIEAGMLALSRGLDVYFRHIRPGDIVPSAE